MHSKMFKITMFLFFSIFMSYINMASAEGIRQAKYAVTDYSTVYVRCPRGNYLPHLEGKGENAAENINGVNDQWFSAANNFYMVPGCDLVLHHSGVDENDPGTEEVIVDCNESNTDSAVCSVADPNVSFDGKKIIYSKILDTRGTLTDPGFKGQGGITDLPKQSAMAVYPNGDGHNGMYNKYIIDGIKLYDSPSLIFEYDLETKKERVVSPSPQCFAGRAYPDEDINWCSNIPVMDTGPFYMADGRIGFTSNRNNGFYKFQLFAMEESGKSLELLGHRATANQLHPITLLDGRILYTSRDVSHGRMTNNQYSLYTLGNDGSFPFIFAGKFDATSKSYHYVTQLSDGNLVVTWYYNHNNTGLGTLEYLPLKPDGAAEFTHLFKNDRSSYQESNWQMGNKLLPFGRLGQYNITENSTPQDKQVLPYESESDWWHHPTRNEIIKSQGKFTHPAAAPNNDLLTVYSIGGSSTMPILSKQGPWENVQHIVGKDAGVWLVDLHANQQDVVTHVAGEHNGIDSDNRMTIIVDHPDYHEIMPRAVVPYQSIYGQTAPNNPKRIVNDGTQDERLSAGEPFGLSGAASLYDRETQPLNGMPWNAVDGGFHSGRKYQNIFAQGADLAIYDNEEIAGIRVSMPVIATPNIRPRGEKWNTGQNHHIRILGEFPVHKDGMPLDEQGNPDTSFIAKIPANTPFFFQTIDKNGMALDIEIASRTMVAGEQQLCGGCHVHTREGQDPFQSKAYVDKEARFLDLSEYTRAPLFSGVDQQGKVIVEQADLIFNDEQAPGVNERQSFGVDWNYKSKYDHTNADDLNGVSKVIAERCQSCHGEGKPAFEQTGLLLDGSKETYNLLTTNKYRNSAGQLITSKTKPGNGLDDLDENGTDRIVPRYTGCCTSSRWLSFFSARSSMLVWALYGKRMDGRNPETGLRAVNLSIEKQQEYGVSNRPDIMVDDKNADHPEIWPKVGEHASYLNDMPENEKRLITRWIEIGAPFINNHDDLIRPVVTFNPDYQGAKYVRSFKLGLWDDSGIDYSKLKVTMNGQDITPDFDGNPNVIDVILPSNVTKRNAHKHSFTVEVWDSPSRNLSMYKPDIDKQNRTLIEVDGNGLMRLLGMK